MLLYKALKNLGHSELRKGVVKIPFSGSKHRLNEIDGFLPISVRVERSI